jgi:hypothetical protein
VSRVAVVARMQRKPSISSRWGLSADTDRGSPDLQKKNRMDGGPTRDRTLDLSRVKVALAIDFIRFFCGKIAFPQIILGNFDPKL